MKNKLLITTAIVAAFSATNVWAAERVEVSGGEQSISGTFENLTVEDKNGGAVYNSGGKVSVDGTFNSNSAKDGGAVYNGNAGIIESLTGTFTDNTASNRGGAIYSSGSSLIEKISGIFTRNSADKGGAISNAGTKDSGSVTIENSTFENNTAKTGGGAIHNMSKANMTITDSSFSGNTANKEVNDFGGGAIYNRGTIDVSGTTFDGNSALYGGALHNVGDDASSANATFTDVTFTNNEATKDGGAVYNGNNGTITSLTGTCTNNEAIRQGETESGRGGVIYNSKTSQINSISGQFSGNKAYKGGAISNAGTMTIENSTFSNNAASEAGGAIHNMAGANLTLNGDNVFSSNTDKTGNNDLYNHGNITVNGHLTLDGGISGTGTTTFAEGSHLTVNAGSTAITNKVVNNGADMDMIFANGFTGQDGYQLITGGFEGEEFTILNQDNGLFTINSKGNGTYDVVKKAVDEIAASTGANANQAATIDAVTSGTTENETFNAAANNINALAQSSDSNDVKAAVDAATVLAPEVAPLVQHNETQTATQVFSAVSTRLTGGSVSTGGEGMSSGDNIFERAAVWVQGLFNHSELDDTAKVKGFDSDTTGVAMGAEKYINDNTKVGVGYAYSDTDIDGFMRSTDVDTHTAFIYGEYKPSNWYVNGIASYGWSSYSEDKNVTGVNIKSDYDAETFGLQAMTGYDMQMKNFGLTPEVGLRYVHISQDGYTDSAGQSISGNDIDVLTGVIGAKISKNFTLENGMKLKPEARIAATYDLMNDDTSSVVTLANGSAYAVEGEALDRFGMEFGAGVTADLNDNVELSAAYEGKFRQDYQDHTGLLNAKYKF